MKLSIVLLATATSIAAPAASLLGQVRFEIAPRYGVFLPTRQAYLGTETIYQNQSGQVAGLNLTAFLTSTLGFEISAAREWGQCNSTAVRTREHFARLRRRQVEPS